MKRSFFCFALILLVLLTIGNAGDVDDKVDDKVVEELQKNENVNVIVVLKEEIENEVGIFSVTEDVKVSDVVEDLNIEKEKEFSIINGFSGEITSDDLVNLLDDVRVERIEYDYPVSAFLDSSIFQINASLLHPFQVGSTNLTGIDETVCVIDTGINYSHLDLGGCYGNNDENSSCKVLGGYDFVNSNNDPLDDHGHGTHVAGIIASNDTYQRGVAPDANLVALKVLDNAGLGTTSNVIAGIDWCVNNATRFGISVISMSLGNSLNATSYCDDDFTSYRDSINAAIANNIFVSVAAGNDGNATGISYPACIENSTSIGSVGDSDVISSFSNRASILDLLAPGENINATDYAGAHVEKSGTSMAAPHVSGAAALLRQFFKTETGNSLTPNETLGNLSEYGFIITDSGASELNFSRIDVYNSTIRMDIYSPRIDATFSSDPVELNQQNLTINISYYDFFLDSKTGNVSYPNGTLLADFIDSIELTTENLTDLGIYTVVGWSNDTNGNENLTTKTFTVQDTSGTPTFTSFNSLAGDPNFTATNLVDFNVTIGSKYNLSNVTLYHNFTDWHANETLLLDINETNSEFNTSFSEGVYLYGFGACDINNICNYSENRTLIVDQSDPVVNLFAPGNTSTVTVLPIDFTFNVTDYGIGSCTLTLNDVTNETLNSVTLGNNNIFTENIYYLSNGNYNWSVNCIDNINRNTTSNTFDFTLSCSSDFSRDCTSYSACSGGTKTRLCYDANYCTSASQNQSSTSGCSSDDDDSGSGGSSGGSTGGAATTATDQSVLKFQANAGDVKSFGISKDVGISGLELEFKNAVTNAEVTVVKQDEQPSGVSAVTNVYKYVKININFVDTDLKGARIKFNVPKSWILTNALNDPTKIYMSRYTDGKWQKLETLTAGSEETLQKYEAITPGFSYFAISSDKITTGATVVTGDVVAEENETEIVDEIKTEVVEKKNLFSNFFTGSAIKDLFSGKINLYYFIGIGIVVIVILLLLIKFRAKLKFLGKIFSPFKKIFSSKLLTKPFSGFKKIENKIAYEKKEIKKSLKIRHKSKIEREKDKLEEEKRKLEDERREIEKMRKEEEKIKIREEKEKERKEREFRRQKENEERERRMEEERKLREEQEKIRKEKKQLEKEEKIEKKKEKEESFRIKHNDNERWEDFELEGSDD